MLSVLALMVKRREKGRWSEEDSRGRIIGDAVLCRQDRVRARDGDRLNHFRNLTGECKRCSIDAGA